MGMSPHFNTCNYAGG